MQPFGKCFNEISGNINITVGLSTYVIDDSGRAKSIAWLVFWTIVPKLCQDPQTDKHCKDTINTGVPTTMTVSRFTFYPYHTHGVSVTPDFIMVNDLGPVIVKAYAS